MAQSPSWVNIRAILILLSAAAAATLPAGCEAPAVKPSSDELAAMKSQQDQNRLEAEQLYRQALEAVMEKKSAEAHRLFDQALRLNPYHGGAHNDLGALYFREGDLYQAAQEFGAAARNLPNRPEPLYNLGMVWEAAGRVKEAADAYYGALKISPEDPLAMENLARVYIKMDTNRAETIHLLDDALLRETRPDWQNWIRLELLRLKGPSPESATRPSAPEAP